MLLTAGTTGLVGGGAMAVGGSCRGGRSVFGFSLLAFFRAMRAQFGELFFGENLVNTEAGAIHLFGDFGTEVTFAFKEGEELVGVITLLLR